MQRTSSLTSKGQVTIPVEIRRLLGLGPHDKVAFIVEDHQVRIAPTRLSVVERTKGILHSDMLALSPQEEKRAAELAIAEQADPLLRS